MSGKKATNKLFAPAASTLDRVLSERETAELLHCCTKTLRQEFAAGRAPARVRLSARRIGYRLSAIYRWLDTRVEAPPGADVCWRSDRNPGRPVPGRWSRWDRAFLVPGRLVNATL